MCPSRTPHRPLRLNLAIAVLVLPLAVLAAGCPGGAPTCQSAADCPSKADHAASCNKNVCEYEFTGGTPCTREADCPRGSECGKHAETGFDVCLPQAKCLSTPECSSGRSCRGGFCARVPCVTDLECDLGERCKGTFCDLNGCRTDGDCATGLRCDTNTFLCVECKSAADCPADRPICRSDQRCAACLSDLDCGNGRPPFCLGATGTCVHCMKNEDCAPGLACSASKVCRGVPEGGACAAYPASITPCSTDTACANADPGFPRCINGNCGRYLTCDVGGLCVQITRSGNVSLECLRQCSPYAPDCPVGKGCALLSTGPDEIAFTFGIPLGACLDQPAGAARYNEACGGSTVCLYGLECVPSTSTAGTCRRYCDPVVTPSPCDPGTVCQRIFAGMEAGEDIGACYPASNWNKTCSNDAICGGVLACGVGRVPWGPPLDPEYDGYGNRCEFAVGAKGPLEPCAKNDDCKTDICLGDASAFLVGAPSAGRFCYGACKTSLDCPEGACEKWEFAYSLGGQAVIYDVFGCRGRPCASNAGCSGGASPRVCGVEPSPTSPDSAVVQRCEPPRGAGTTGATCSQGSDCQSGICFDAPGDGGTARICWEACDPAAIPTTCPATMRCAASVYRAPTPSGSPAALAGCVP